MSDVVTETEVKPEPKFRREIQPKDDAGNPIGSPHVYEAETEQELFDKMAAAISNGTKKIHEQSRKLALEPSNFSVPEGADLEEDISEDKPRALTPEEKFELANKLRDPETVDEAFDRLYEARFGRKPQDAAKIQTRSARDAAQTRSYAEASAFTAEHPEYVLCQTNSDAMLSFMSARKMAPTKKNFELAFKELSAGGLLTLRSTDTPVVPAEPKSEVRTEPTPAVAPQPRTVIPSAITRSNASGAAPVRPKKPSAKDVAMMNASEYKAYLESQK